MKKIKISCPASCGELFQCVTDGHERLLSYGINKWSWVIAEQGSHLTVSELKGDKVRQALNLLSEQQGLSFQQVSDIPVGKGYSSSTADMVSGLQAFSVYRKEEHSPADLTRLCAQIEPTDSVAFPNWTVINPLTGAVIWQTDWQPELYVYILEPIETVATLDLVRMKDCPLYPAAESGGLLALFQEACQERNLSKLGHVATYSALLNNERLAKPYLKEIIALARAYQCLGINIAHSGTLVGLLLQKENLARLPMMEREIAQSCFAAYYQKRSLCKIIYEGVRQWEEVTS